MCSTAVQKRRIGQRVEDVDTIRRDLLNGGTVATTTLTECLAVDFEALLRSVMPEVGEAGLLAVQQAAKLGISRRMVLTAQVIAGSAGANVVTDLQRHPSDTVRGWACFIIGAAQGMGLAERLAAIRTLADDAHFGVREWAWLAVRPHLAADLDHAITLLAGWTADPSERLRRFACEAIRPRGVWCAHIAALKQQPGRALPVLAPLKSDPARYVQDSVGNWLNDAAKDQPAWVRTLCDAWLQDAPVPETKRICDRALRSLPRS